MSQLRGDKLLFLRDDHLGGGEIPDNSRIREHVPREITARVAPAPYKTDRRRFVAEGGLAPSPQKLTELGVVEVNTEPLDARIER